MGLLENAKQALDGFDATKDKPTSYDLLPDGDYQVVLSNVDHFVTDGGYDGFRIQLEVLEGEHSGYKDSNMFNFDEVSSKGKAIPQSVIASHIKLVARLANAVGITLKDADWENIDTLVDAFLPAKGKVIILHFSSRENKKNPQYPYKNYDFDPTDQPATPELSDDDIPF